MNDTSWLTDSTETPETLELRAWLRAREAFDNRATASAASEPNPWDEPLGFAPIHDLEQQEARIARTLALLTLDVDDDPEPTPPTSAPHVANYEHIGLEPWAVGA